MNPLTPGHISVLGDFAAVAVGLIIAAVVDVDLPLHLRSRGKEQGGSPTSAADIEALEETISDVEFHVVFAGVSTIFLSLFSAILIVNLNSYSEAVRIAAGVTVLAHAKGTYETTKQAVRHNDFSRMNLFWIVGGTACGVASAIAAAGLAPNAQSLILYLSIFWAMLVTAIAFFALLRLRRQLSH